MIRSSALLTAVAMAILIAGVAAANLGLIYLSIAVSILAAATLAVGVLLRRRELFGEAAASPKSAQPGPAAAETAKARPVPVRSASGDQITADHSGRSGGGRGDRDQQGDLAAQPRKAGSGTAADTDPARWPASIAAKGAPATARSGGARPAGRGRAARSPSAREPATRKPGARGAARGGWAVGEPGDREPAEREPAAQDATGRDAVPTGSTERGAGWPPRPGREAGPGRPPGPVQDRAGAARDRDPSRDRAGTARDRNSSRDRAGARRDRNSEPDQEPAAARQNREHAGRGRGRGGERDRAAAASAGRAGTASSQDRDQETAARTGREQSGPGRDEAAAAQQAEGFRLPPPSERTRARAEQLSRAIPGDVGGDDFWDRVSGELTGNGNQDQPAWPATAGPRAMGTGDAGDRHAGDRDVIPRPSGPPGRDEQLTGPGAEPNWDRVVPPYVDKLARRHRQQRDPEPTPAGADEPGDDAARAVAVAGPAAGSAWSAWSSARTGGQDAAADAEEAGPDSVDPGERAPRPETADTAAGPRPDAAGESGDHQAEPAIRRDGAAATGAGTAGDTGAPAGGSQPAEVSGSGEHEDAGADGPDETAGAGAVGSTSSDDEVTMVPGVPRYHRRGCILIRFLSESDLETTTWRAAEAAGSVPCKACQPGKPASAD